MKEEKSRLLFRPKFREAWRSMNKETRRLWASGGLGLVAATLPETNGIRLTPTASILAKWPRILVLSRCCVALVKQVHTHSSSVRSAQANSFPALCGPICCPAPENFARFGYHGSPVEPPTLRRLRNPAYELRQGPAVNQSLHVTVLWTLLVNALARQLERREEGEYWAAPVPFFCTSI